MVITFVEWLRVLLGLFRNKRRRRKEREKKKERKKTTTIKTHKMRGHAHTHRPHHKRKPFEKNEI